jgi:SecD/SecF fusion protein
LRTFQGTADLIFAWVERNRISFSRQRKTIALWLVVGIAFVTLGLMRHHLPAFWPDGLSMTQMAFGKAQSGESQVLFEVPRQDVIAERLDTTVDAIRTRLRAAKIGYADLAGSDRTAQVRVRDAADIAKAKAALAELLLPTAPPADEPSSMTEWAMTVLADWLLPASPDADPVVSISELSMEEPEPGLLKFNLTDAGIDFRLDRATAGSITVISRRINEFDLGEPVIERQGSDRFLVKVSGVDDPQQLIDLLATPAKLTFRLVDQSVPVQEALDGHPPAGSKILYSIDDPPTPYIIEDNVIVSGEDLVDAQATQDQYTGQPVVSFRLDEEGAQRFGQATRENVGRLFAILLDDLVISAPLIREPILGGWGQISGYFTEQGTKDLAVLLRTGALPAKLNVLETHFVPD